MINAIMNHHIEDCSRLSNDKVRGMVAILKIANYIVNEISLGSYISAESKAMLEKAKQELMISGDEVNDVRQSLIAYGL